MGRRHSVVVADVEVRCEISGYGFVRQTFEAYALNTRIDGGQYVARRVACHYEKSVVKRLFDHFQHLVGRFLVHSLGEPPQHDFVFRDVGGERQPVQQLVAFGHVGYGLGILFAEGRGPFGKVHIGASGKIIVPLVREFRRYGSRCHSVEFHHRIDILHVDVVHRLVQHAALACAAGVAVGIGILALHILGESPCQSKLSDA